MEAGDSGSGEEYALGLFLFHLFCVNETISIKLGINGQMAYFDLWSMGWYRRFGTKDLDSKTTNVSHCRVKPLLGYL